MLILGAGLAGMTAALELRKAGYKVQILEFNSRARRPQLVDLRRRQHYRARRLHAELRVRAGALPSIPARGGFPIITARCSITASRLNVALEPFIQLNHNAYLHATRAFGAAQPQRYPAASGADFQGQVSELLAKVTQQGASSTRSLARRIRRSCSRRCAPGGALDRDPAKYSATPARRSSVACTRSRRRADRRRSAARASRSRCREILRIADGALSRSRLRATISGSTMFQPVGGMDMIGKAFAREVGDLIRYNAKGDADPAERLAASP